MKKTLLVFISLIMIASSIFAGAPGVNPQNGGFGINMASTKYNFVIEGIAQGDDAEDFTYEKGAYSDEHMVALGGVWNMYSSFHNVLWGAGEFDNTECNTPMTVTVNCPNGFYFESISNPGARRPFALLLVLKESYSSSENQSGTNTNDKQRLYLLQEGENVIDNILYSYDKPIDDRASSMAECGYCQYQYMWFDLVLCLPYDENPNDPSGSYVSSSGNMIYNGRSYNLIEADDYSAVITITVEWNGQSAEVTIPLSGYYSANISSMDTTSSLSVRPMASASNLSINSMQGRQVDIANINFLSVAAGDERKETTIVEGGWFEPDTITTKTYRKHPEYHMFLSSSRSPFDSDSNGFRLVHRGASSSPMMEEYIGFDLRVTTNQTSNGSDKVVYDFDGTEAVTNNILPENAIYIPFKGFGGTGGTVWFAQYDATVSIIMDQQSAPTMKSGVYEEEVYVHIVTDGEKEYEIGTEVTEQ